MNLSWVVMDRLCQEEADAKEEVRRELKRTGKPLRSSADPLSDDELLGKLREFGLDVDRDGVERLCAGALSVEEVADSILTKLVLRDEPRVDWIWISVLALWQRWWPDRPCLELLDDKMQAGYDRDPESNPYAAAGPWLDAWADVLRLCDATGISSIKEFDDRFPLTQSVYNWSQDLQMVLEDARMLRALIGFCEESLRRFPHEDQLFTENLRRAMGQAYFDAGMTEKAGELFRAWLDADPAWGWGWIGWADCYLPWGGRPADYDRAEKLLRRGYRTPLVQDRADIASRLQELCLDTGRPEEARQFGEQAKKFEEAERSRHQPRYEFVGPATPSGATARPAKAGRNDPCPCGSGKKFKKCCLSQAG